MGAVDHSELSTSQFPPRKPKGRGLVVAAVALGLVALLFSWIPFTDTFLGTIVRLVGIVLALAGVFVSHRVMSIIGAVLM